jgi:tRNA pseudouridine(55) synthase
MACGVMQVLVGNECDHINKYFKSDKVYTFDVVVGVQTDTYDPMGLPVNTQVATPADIETIKNRLLSLSGTEIEQRLPVYSAYKIGHVPLWKLHRSGKLLQEDIPVKKRHIRELTLTPEPHRLSLNSYVQEIIPHISRVQGSFRQNEIIEAWRTHASESPDIELTVIPCSTTVSSGTYIRSIVNDLTGFPAHARNITRLTIIDSQ